jgi:hypothetical protein
MKHPSAPGRPDASPPPKRQRKVKDLIERVISSTRLGRSARRRFLCATVFAAELAENPAELELWEAVYAREAEKGGRVQLEVEVDSSDELDIRPVGKRGRAGPIVLSDDETGTP